MYYAVYQVYYVYPPGKANTHTHTHARTHARTHTHTHTHPQFSRFYPMKLLKTKEIRAIRSSFRVLIGFITPKWPQYKENEEKGLFPPYSFQKKLDPVSGVTGIPGWYWILEIKCSDTTGVGLVY